MKIKIEGKEAQLIQFKYEEVKEDTENLRKIVVGSLAITGPNILPSPNDAPVNADIIDDSGSVSLRLDNLTISQTVTPPPASGSDNIIGASFVAKMGE